MFTIALLAALAPRAGEAYLKDGKLTARVEVTTTQGGARGITGHYFAVEPDGTWSTGPFFAPAEDVKGKPTATGKLTPAELAELATVLDRNDLGGLPSHGKPVANPQSTTIAFGERSVRYLRGDGKEDEAVRRRYDEIAVFVTALCRAKK